MSPQFIRGLSIRQADIAQLSDQHHRYGEAAIRPSLPLPKSHYPTL